MGGAETVHPHRQPAELRGRKLGERVPALTRVRVAPYDDTVEDGQGHLQQLTRLGLTMYEAKAYLALIRRGSSTAAEVARIAGVPRQRI